MSVHLSSTLRRNATRSGSVSAFSKTASAMFALGSSSTSSGTVYSRTAAAPSSHPVGRSGRNATSSWQARRVPLVDLMDETFVVADAGVLAARLRDPALVRRAWPGLDLVVFMDRGDAGIRWTVTGDLVGSCEIWLEPYGDGVIVHYFLRADPTRRGSRTEPRAGAAHKLQRQAIRIGREHATRWKAVLHTLKDELEAGRRPGEPSETSGSPGPVTPNGSSPERSVPKSQT